MDGKEGGVKNAASLNDETARLAMPMSVAEKPAKKAPETAKPAKPEPKREAKPEIARDDPKSSPKPTTVKTLTTALKPKADIKPEATPAAKVAAKPAAKPAAPKAEAEAVPSVAVQAPQAAAETEAPAKPAAKPVAKPAAESAPPVVAAEPVAAAPVQPVPAQSHSGVMPGPMRPLNPPRAMAKAENFADGDFVVYPTHGVGKVERIAVEEIAGHKLELIHITFDENRMTLRVPTNKARTAGLRKLASRKQFDEVLATLKGRARIKRTMWSRRAQEYEAKINSGDPSAIAEVVRDLHRNAGQPDQSFSERQIYESALDRLAAEYAALEQVDKNTAIERLIAHLKSD